jgi:CRP/FNR family transcriptional regulator, anaerobic regulatory protein
MAQVGPSWLGEAGLPADIDDVTRTALCDLKPQVIPAGGILFRPGDEARGFIIVLSGRISVFLTGASGREILLYDVTHGESCVQTTLGLLGGEAYSGEAIAESDVRAVLVPRVLFLDLMNSSQWFRHVVFKSFGTRISDITKVLEQVAFVKVEQRLARHLLASADAAGVLDQTHQDLATAIGSVREVVSRRLEVFAKRGLVTLERGQIVIRDKAGLHQVAAEIAE